MPAAGDPIYASDFDKPLVRLLQQTAQSFASGAAAALTFGTSSTVTDTHGYHSETTNNTRVTPAKAGYYRVTVTASFASATYTQIVASPAKNGARAAPQDIMRPDAASTAAASAQSTALLSANGTSDYFEAFGAQSSSGAQNTNVSAGFQSVFEVEYLRPL
jgi:hypothetical protein